MGGPHSAGGPSAAQTPGGPAATTGPLRSPACLCSDRRPCRAPSEDAPGPRLGPPPPAPHAAGAGADRCGCVRATAHLRVGHQWGATHTPGSPAQKGVYSRHLLNGTAGGRGVRRAGAQGRLQRRFAVRGRPGLSSERTGRRAARRGAGRGGGRKLLPADREGQGAAEPAGQESC